VRRTEKRLIHPLLAVAQSKNNQCGVELDGRRTRCLCCSAVEPTATFKAQEVRSGVHRHNQPWNLFRTLSTISSMLIMAPAPCWLPLLSAGSAMYDRTSMHHAPFVAPAFLRPS
jgi:hypothetical protein